MYEVWYWKWNVGDQATWLRMTCLKSADGKIAKAEMWGIHFSPQGKFGVKQAFPFEAYHSLADGCQIGSSFLSPTESMGSIQGTHSFQWHLNFKPGLLNRRFVHAPRWLKSLGLSKSSVDTPRPDLRVSGTFTMNGVTQLLQNVPGMCGHIWGKKMAKEWAWGHCNDPDQGLVFEILSAKLGLTQSLESPYLSAICLRYFEGTVPIVLEWNGITELTKIETHPTLLEWNFSAVKVLNDKTYRLNGQLIRPAGDAVGVVYQDTDGSSLYCHNSKRASLTLTISRDDGSERKFEAKTLAAFETVRRDKEPSVDFVIG